MACSPTTARSLSTRLVWVDRAGRLLARFTETGRYGIPGISPDGARVAFAVYDTGINKNQIWIGDVARGTQTSLTAEPGDSAGAIWSPDGASIAFRSDRKHQEDLIVRASSGSTADEAFSNEPGQKAPAGLVARRTVPPLLRPTGHRHPGWSAVGPPDVRRPKPFVLYPSPIARNEAWRPSLPTADGWPS